MLCQRCQQRTATVRVTKVNNGIRETNYLCEKCAAETGALNLFGGMGANFIPAEQMNRVSRRLTERAQKALAIAEQEAKDRHSAYINTEHMLLGLFEVEDGIAAKVLDELHLNADVLAENIDDEANYGNSFRGLSPRAKRALQLAVEEAVRSGVNFVDTEHLLLGLAAEDEGMASHWLLDMADADVRRIRQMVYSMLQSGRGDNSSDEYNYDNEGTPYGDNDVPDGKRKSKTPTLDKFGRDLTEMARKEPKRVVFAEANHANMLQAASTAMKEGICKPILLGNDELIGKLAESIGVDLSGMQIINLRHPNEEDRRIRYAQLLTEKRQREGMTYAEAHEKMFDRNYFGMMMVEAGEADAFITGTYSKYAEVIGIREGYKHFGAMHIMNTKCGTYFLADTLINRKPTTETLIDIAKLSYDSVRFFAKDPVIAMVSYSNFGSDNQGSPLRVHEAIKILHEQYPEIIIDGEMQMNFALNNKLRDKSYPFNKLKGREVNTIVFPNLSSANSAYKMMLEMGVAESIGPIQMGLNKPIHFTDIASSTRDIVNLTTVAVLDAIVQERRNKQ